MLLTRTLVVAIIAVAAATALPDAASAQEQGASFMVNGRTIARVQHNLNNDVQLTLSASYDCGGTINDTFMATLLDEHVGAAAKVGMLSVMMSAFLAGRTVDLEIVRYTSGSSTHCSIRRVFVN